ncbi:fumarylacetoacetate hydrolase family protein [Streptomyces sp. NBC_01005]|uniref:fumarylacetoacetate hydrolase family protein n=1 Tax=unclassified Streptomyces TaxID=2593676 RepID=UPI002E369644|nr:fumarylacetoacetate hydrolase family protein [Streptomyces sp. NBC_01362]WSW02972.1 fumarylacetoacetate hydrolase family protein [Streptomyces sp. NBC_01005]WTC92478.1 fumarylacetoacetate hydrolase family protein [Streptomyces sp. NBC_01650]
MRFANVNGRSTLVTGSATGIDLARATGDESLADPRTALSRWEEITERAIGLDTGSPSPGATVTWSENDLLCPSPAPGQILCIGLNYVSHAVESGLAIPDHPFVFAKLTSSLAAPFGPVTVANDTIDWEAEVVVVIGKTAHRVPKSEAWGYVAGVTAGQDISDRSVQNRLGVNSQPTLGKSRPGYGPVGPFIATPDEFNDPDDISVSCTINGETVQSGSTRDLIFSIPKVVAYLSDVVVLRPGDLIFTGTPSGVGIGRTPPRFLNDGDVLETTVGGVGTMHHEIRAQQPGPTGAMTATQSGTKE